MIPLKKYRRFLKFYSILIICSFVSLYLIVNNNILHLNESLSIENQLIYQEIHNKIINKNSQTRVVFYRESRVAGYGNNLYSLMTAFLVATITESALLIDWPQIKNYIKEPFKMSFHKFNDSSPLDFNQKQPRIYTINTSSINSWNYNKQLIGDEIKIVGNYSRYYVSDIIPYFFDLLQNRAYAEKLVRYGYVSNRTVSRAFELLSDQDSLHSHRIDFIFFIGFEFAGRFLNSHWIPRSDLAVKIDTFVGKNFRKAFVIGM